MKNNNYIPPNDPTIVRKPCPRCKRDKYGLKMIPQHNIQVCREEDCEYSESIESFPH